MGRPSKLTPQVQELIVDGITAGLTYRLSCERAGIFPSTFYAWIERGERQAKGRYQDFAEAVARAKSDSALRLVSQITLAAPKDWRAAAFMLERRFPDDYGRRTELTGKDGGPVKVDTTADAALADGLLAGSPGAEQGCRGRRVPMTDAHRPGRGGANPGAGRRP